MKRLCILLLGQALRIENRIINNLTCWTNCVLHALNLIVQWPNEVTFRTEALKNYNIIQLLCTTYAINQSIALICGSICDFY